MIEWLSLQYLHLIANFTILLNNPSGCIAVKFLQTAALTLLALAGIKLALHMVSLRRLKSRFPPCPVGRERLLRIYRHVASQAGLGRIPPLHLFADRRPLAFAAGLWRPAVFVAPRLAEVLPDAELRALLTHELTHIRRRDNLKTWLLEISYPLMPALVVQFFGLRFISSVPNSAMAVCGALGGLLVVRLVLWRPIQLLREQTCDDWTVEQTRDPLSLASALVRSWRLSREMPSQQWGFKLAAVEPFLPLRGGLEARVRRLVNYRRPRWKFLLARGIRTAAGAALAAAVLFLIHFHMQGHQAQIEKGSICMEAFLDRI